MASYTRMQCCAWAAIYVCQVTSSSTCASFSTSTVSVNALNNAVTSKYVAQEKCWFKKLILWYGFVAWKRAWLRRKGKTPPLVRTPKGTTHRWVCCCGIKNPTNSHLKVLSIFDVGWTNWGKPGRAPHKLVVTVCWTYVVWVYEHCMSDNLHCRHGNPTVGSQWHTVNVCRVGVQASHAQWFTSQKTHWVCTMYKRVEWKPFLKGCKGIK